MPDWIMYVIFGLGLVSMIGSFWAVAASGSSADSYAELSSSIVGIIVSNLLFTILLTVGLILYHVRTGATQVMQLVLSGVTIFLSITAVSIAVLQK
jgi:hypothetical protein